MYLKPFVNNGDFWQISIEPVKGRQRDLSVLFKFTRAEVLNVGITKEREMVDDIQGLIRNSVWANKVDKSKIHGISWSV